MQDTDQIPPSDDVLNSFFTRGVFPMNSENVASGPILPSLPCQLLHENAKLPSRGSEYAAGLDLYAAESTWLPGPVLEYNTGVAVAIPSGYVGLLIPRSSVSNTSLRMANSVGVIDSDYRGAIKVRYDYVYMEGSEPNYDVGEKVAQLVIVPFLTMNPVQVNALEMTDRGANGFGSTGRT